MDSDITRPKIINKILINLARAENIVAVLDRIWRLFKGIRSAAMRAFHFLDLTTAKSHINMRVACCR
jgi:hypothetical protein